MLYPAPISVLTRRDSPEKAAVGIILINISCESLIPHGIRHHLVEVFESAGRIFKAWPSYRVALLDVCVHVVDESIHLGGGHIVRFYLLSEKLDGFGIDFRVYALLSLKLPVTQLRFDKQSSTTCCGVVNSFSRLGVNNAGDQMPTVSGVKKSPATVLCSAKRRRRYS